MAKNTTPLMSAGDDKFTVPVATEPRETVINAYTRLKTDMQMIRCATDLENLHLIINFQLQSKVPPES